MNAFAQQLVFPRLKQQRWRSWSEEAEAQNEGANGQSVGSRDLERAREIMIEGRRCPTVVRRRKEDVAKCCEVSGSLVDTRARAGGRLGGGWSEAPDPEPRDRASRKAFRWALVSVGAAGRRPRGRWQRASVRPSVVGAPFPSSSSATPWVGRGRVRSRREATACAARTSITANHICTSHDARYAPGRNGYVDRP
jgi:hypothetical protein